VSERDVAIVDEFLRSAKAMDRRTRERLRPWVPIRELQVAAREHPDPWVRRMCLGILDHEASDESVGVFLAALHDPVAPVREVALHGLACERCRVEALCVPDVVPQLVAALDREPSTDVRCRLIGILARLMGRSEDALAAIRRSAESDGDPLVREAASIVLGLAPGRNLNPEDLRRRARTRKAKAAQRQEAPRQASSNPRT
jgi:hypothetical protein